MDIEHQPFNYTHDFPINMKNGAIFRFSMYLFYQNDDGFQLSTHLEVGGGVELGAISMSWGSL